jgi:hypothetical protein
MVVQHYYGHQKGESLVSEWTHLDDKAAKQVAMMGDFTPLTQSLIPQMNLSY